LTETEFRDQYYEERFRIHVDQLNLLYVAFTRAVDVLCVIAPAAAEKGDVKTVADLINSVLSEEPFAGDHRTDCPHGGRCWQTGDIEISQPETSQISGQFTRLHKSPSLMATGRLIMKSGNLDVFDREAGMKLDRGRIMHRIFERIKTVRDVEAAVQRLVSEGKVEDKEKDTLVSEIKGLISNPPLSEWFSGEWKVLNEQDILTPKGEVYRPDRIMLREDRLVLMDYKFGTQRSDTYHRQVNNYRLLLQEMGYKNIDAYLWYVNLKELVKV
jgi:ATP-dependent exoDNAse (exonuclease V) beta subunit